MPGSAELDCDGLDTEDQLTCGTLGRELVAATRTLLVGRAGGGTFRV
jgi:hypothetical protein